MKCSKTLIVLISLICLMVFIEPSVVLAQAGDELGDEISLFVGSMLPNQIDGVDEILPVFGGRYGLGVAAGMVEVGAANTHAHGVDFTTADISLRGNLPLEDGFTVIVYGGADLNYYRPVNSTERRSETGFHIGAGGMMLVTDSLWLRTDLKFMGGPGTSLSLLFGLAFRGPVGGGGDGGE